VIFFGYVAEAVSEIEPLAKLVILVNEAEIGADALRHDEGFPTLQ